MNVLAADLPAVHVDNRILPFELPAHQLVRLQDGKNRLHPGQRFDRDLSQHTLVADRPHDGPVLTLGYVSSQPEVFKTANDSVKIFFVMVGFQYNNHGFRFLLKIVNDIKPGEKLQHRLKRSDAPSRQQKRPRTGSGPQPPGFPMEPPKNKKPRIISGYPRLDKSLQDCYRRRIPQVSPLAQKQ